MTRPPASRRARFDRGSSRQRRSAGAHDLGRPSAPGHLVLLAFERCLIGPGPRGCAVRLVLDDDAAADELDDGEGWYEDDLVGLAAYTVVGERIGEVSGLTIRTAGDLLPSDSPTAARRRIPSVEALRADGDSTPVASSSILRTACSTRGVRP